MAILVVDKPVGPSSFDVVRRVRRVLSRLWGADTLRALKVGHGGTLDPMATGVLPVCIGEATKLAPFLLEADKSYEATLRFGIETDTLDAEGSVVAETPVGALDAAAIEAQLAAFRGPIMQIPPMYSALKHQGRPLYSYAREGTELERTPRAVTVHTLELVAFTAPDEARIRVSCSKGTYIRTLASDLGRAVGPGAHLIALRRTASGPFGLAQALPLAEIEARVSAGQTLPLVSLSAALTHLPEVRVTPSVALAMSQGKRLSPEAVGVPAELRGRVRVLREDESLLAVAEVTDEAARPLRVFAPEGFSAASLP